MKRKILSAAIASTFAVVYADDSAASKPAFNDIDPPTNFECEYDAESEDGVTAWWDDNGEGDKYGGDLDLDVHYFVECEDGFSTDGTTHIELDLDTDSDAAWGYFCEDGFCHANATWDEIGEAVDESVDPEAICAAHDGIDDFGWIPTFDEEGFFDSINADIKSIDPGKGRGSQNKTKDSAECTGDSFF
ncbi:MAG: hypothetical protein ACI9H8_001407 [Lysobacterales bacterium]|jgi:hypothetical protein